MAEQFPDHEFLTWLKHPTLFIEGYRLVWNKKFLKADGDELHYFYCSNKGRFKCKKSGKAMKSEEDAFILYGYAGQHSEEWRPSSAVLHVKKIRDAIKQQVLADPTVKPIAVYLREVTAVRDNLTAAEKVEFDNIMPTQQTMNASIHVWKRMVIPAAPEFVSQIDTTGPFFTLESGENMVKHDGFVNDDQDRRIIMMTSEKIMRAATQMATNWVMDATFKVDYFLTYVF